MIPESQHSDSPASEEFRPRSIPNLVRAIVVPTTIQFDREPCSRTIEIEYVGIEWGAGGEICSLQNFGSANAAKECAQRRLSFYVARKLGSQRIILITNAISEKCDQLSPHLAPLPACGARRSGAWRCFFRPCQDSTELYHPVPALKRWAIFKTQRAAWRFGGTHILVLIRVHS